MAEENGYKGYVQHKSIEAFISEYEYNRMDINDYKNYIISNKAGGTYAYEFLKIVNNVEIYTPNSKYGWIHAVGIRREKGERGKPRVGAPMRNTKTVSFLGITNYQTVYGVFKNILIFDRAKKFRDASQKN